MKTFAVIVFALVLAIAGTAQAQVNVASGGDWEAAGTWSLGHTPAGGEDVVIPSGVIVTNTH